MPYICFSHQSCCLVAALWVLSFLPPARGKYGGIPGTTQTISGYDTELGTDAICWKSQNAVGGIAMPNPLVKGYVCSLDGITLLQACPQGCNISGTPPEELILGERLRTGREYLYSIKLDINLTSLGAKSGFTSDRGPGIIAVQILNCASGLTGFCSPFIHEEANARLAAAAAAVRAANPNIIEKPAPPLPRGSLHGETHVHSGYVEVILNLADGPVFQDIEVQVPMVVLEPGEYISIASAQMYFLHEEEGHDPHMYRYDMGNALSGKTRIVTYQAPAEILDVPDGVVYASYGLIGASSGIILFLLVQTIIHRNNQVMKLSQGSFLILFLFSGLVATASSFLMEPKSDFYCRASVPIIVISLQVFYAVTAGRLWRIHTLISPLLLKTLSLKKDIWWTRFTKACQNTFSRCCRCGTGRPRKFRTQVTDLQLAGFVFSLVSPQLVLQILSLLLQPRSRSIDFNQDESKGRAECNADDDIPIGLTIEYYGYGVFAALVLGLLITAVQSRKMPSLFNESRTIFDSTMTTLIIMVMGVTILLVTQDPSTSPAVSYLIWIFCILSMTVNTSLRIVLPKLRMIWRGDTVIVSKLVMDHTRGVRESGAVNSLKNSSCAEPTNTEKTYIYDQASLYNNGLPPSSSVQHQRHHGANPSSGTSDGFATSSIENYRSSDLIPSETEPDYSDGGPQHPQSPARTVPKAAAPQQVSCQEYDLPQPERTNGDGVVKQRSHRKPTNYVIESDKAPSRRLILKMVDMQEHLHHVNERIMSGMAVSHEEWERTRLLSLKFGETFHDEVKFAWEMACSDKQQHKDEENDDVGNSGKRDGQQSCATEMKQAQEQQSFPVLPEEPFFEEEPMLGDQVGI